MLNSTWLQMFRRDFAGAVGKPPNAHFLDMSRYLLLIADR